MISCCGDVANAPIFKKLGEYLSRKLAASVRGYHFRDAVVCNPSMCQCIYHCLSADVGDGYGCWPPCCPRLGEISVKLGKLADFLTRPQGARVWGERVGVAGRGECVAVEGVIRGVKACGADGREWVWAGRCDGVVLTRGRERSRMPPRPVTRRPPK